MEVGGPEKLAWFPPSFLPLLILLFLSWLRQWAARFLSPVVCCVEELRHCRRSSKSWRAIFSFFSNPPPPTPAPHSALVTLAPTPLRCRSESGQKKRRKKEKADGKEKRISSCQSAIALPIFWPSLPQLLSLPIFATVWTFQKLAVVGWLARLVCESSFTVSSVCVLVQAVHFYYTGFWIQTFLFLGGRTSEKIGRAWCVCVCVNSDYVFTLKKKSGQNPGIGKFVGDFEGGALGPR